MIIPIVIICYNNYKYVQNMVNQLVQRNLGKNIIIFDNMSTCQETINYLKNVQQLVFYNKENVGPWISKDKNTELYNLLPNKFIVTDPDLELNPNLPENFIEILSKLSDKYNCEKVGFALDISDSDKMFTGPYTDNLDIKNWESLFWVRQIQDSTYELYRAQIDTTFALITKNNPPGDIRVAGNFIAKHLPWYTDNKIYNIYENFMASSSSTKISTISSIIIKYTNNNFDMIVKNNEIFFIKKDDNFNKFWTEQYSTWQDTIFKTLDRFLQKDKNYIEIGSDIGQTALYAARKSKHIFILENDVNKNLYLSTICKNNLNNYTLIKNDIQFFDNIPNNISLIRVNLEGGEEHILNKIFNIHTTKNIPLLVTFKYSSWKNQNIDEFKILSEAQRELIKNNSNVTLIFINQT